MAAMNGPSRRRTRSPSHGPISIRKSGAEAWRNTALAAVVSLFAATKVTKVSAWTTPTSMARQETRRAAGTNASSMSAAMPARKLATCQLVKVVALIAAPPVENRNAASRTSRRAIGTAGSNPGIRPNPRIALTFWVLG